jgi:hypothetical protein
MLAATYHGRAGAGLRQHSLTVMSALIAYLHSPAFFSKVRQGLIILT